MNENMKRWLKNILSFAAVIGISTAVLWLMSLISDRIGDVTADSALHSRFEDILPADSYEDLPIYDAENVISAHRAVTNGETAGYAVDMSVMGYGGSMEITVSVSADASRVLGIKIGEHGETENLGAKVTEKAFLNQFENAVVPLTLGKTELKSGTYFVESGEYSGGYRDNVTLTVENGRITRAIWDAESENGGKSKRQASIDGEYVMTADGLLWHEQAQLLETRLIELQSPTKLVYNDDGKTDAVAGVSISISPFVTLAQKCLEQAGGQSEGTGIDGVSGATVSSKAVIDAANNAVKFISDYILTN